MRRLQSASCRWVHVASPIYPQQNVQRCMSWSSSQGHALSSNPTPLLYDRRLFRSLSIFRWTPPSACLSVLEWTKHPLGVSIIMRSWKNSLEYSLLLQLPFACRLRVECNAEKNLLQTTTTCKNRTFVRFLVVLDLVGVLQQIRGCLFNKEASCNFSNLCSEPYD